MDYQKDEAFEGLQLYAFCGKIFTFITGKWIENWVFCDKNVLPLQEGGCQT